MGFEAVQTKLSQSPKVDQIRKLGIAFVVIFCVSMCCACPVACVPQSAFVHLALTRISFLVVGPWLSVVMYDVSNVNKNNIASVDNFSIVNECGDEYTKLP